MDYILKLINDGYTIRLRKGVGDGELEISVAKGKLVANHIIMPNTVNMDSERYINYTLAKLVDSLNKPTY